MHTHTYKNITFLDHALSRLMYFKNIILGWIQVWLSGKNKREAKNYIKFYSLNSKKFGFNQFSINNNLVEFMYKSKKLKFHYDCSRQLFNTFYMTKENFCDEQFKNLDVYNKNVIDIGANIGDSAIYFVLNGAKHVFAYEPYPYSYGIACKNIVLNDLKNKITLINKACGKKGYISLDNNFKNVGGNNLKSFKNGKLIKICSLSDIVKDCNFKKGVLKIDCEGHEYDLVNNANVDVLRIFDQIAIEYHYGYINLVKKLKEAGFSVKKTLPFYFLNNEVANHDMLVGFIYATKK